ncbi:MFS transporter [Desmospora activa]|uniref:MFS transporter n=1 Tax=Desmospora activa TaxID=500615 RepID=UPI000D308678|nr:MFS transporter [Desmospora activa]
MGDEQKERRLFRLIWWSSFCWSFGLAMYQGVIGKYAIDHFQLSPLAYGWLDSVREWPGLCLVILLALLSRLSMRWLWVCSLLLTAVGLWLHAWSLPFLGLLGITLLTSTGVHVGAVVRDTLTMAWAKPTVRARRLGQMASGSAAAGLLGLGAVALLSGTLPLKVQLVIAGCWSVGGAIFVIPLQQKQDDEGLLRRGLLFRWRYRSYYGLALLSALREMVTLTFAVFLLLRDIGWTERELALLLAGHGLLAVILRPWVGAWIDRVGEAKALAVNYAVVTVLFLGYGWVREAWVLALIFVMDHLLTALDEIALSTYVSKWVQQDEWAATLAMGSTIAHAFAVLMPLVGGMLWLTLGATAPFLLGATVTVIACAVCVRLTHRGGNTVNSKD